MENSVPAPERAIRILVLSGPSGSGKSTVVNRLIQTTTLPIEKAVSATTRPPRPHEQNGVDYHFLSPEEFETKQAAGEFLETAEVHRTGHWYGTLRSEVERAIGQRRWSLLEIDVDGAAEVRRAFPGSLLIFLKTKSLEEYESRLRGRGTESAEVIARRMQTAAAELTRAADYDFQVNNDDLDRAVGEIVGIVEEREAQIDAGSV
ncbi:guanylate kinase [Stratiformator vulcanicus]|uniref:guanylate kinase n=1 Tax=Stratiformator vulcanicus TaxID=2527980 RepID=UPI00287765FF|nr:guanylate kinase [Stratiformator vulcanicus]